MRFRTAPRIAATTLLLMGAIVGTSSDDVVRGTDGTDVATTAQQDQGCAGPTTC